MRLAAFLVFFCMSLTACSIQNLAINSIGDVLASGASVFESDNDPMLVAQALPFSLKLIESLLQQQPAHGGLLLAAASGYVSYSYAFVSQEAERLSLDDIDAARIQRLRARNLFLRAHDYAGRALSVEYPEIGVAMEDDFELVLPVIVHHSDRDIELLYWNAAALGLAISVSRNEPRLLARLPEVEAMLARALELDEAWNQGALHEFAINIAGVSNLSQNELERHYDRALELSQGQRASLYVSYALADAVPRQDRAAFTDLMSKALAVNIDAQPELRLANVMAQQRAQWLLANDDEFFLD